MDTTLLLAIALFGAAASSLMILVYFRNSAPKQDFKSLLGRIDENSYNKVGVSQVSKDSDKKVNAEKLEELKRLHDQKKGAKQKDSMEARLLRAGVFSKKEQDFYKKAGPMIGLVAFFLLFLIGTLFTSLNMALVVGLLGGAVGSRYPSMALDKKEARRSEEILYYLPLVIEQIAIGVSSSLDIGPCLGMVVKMADERNSHNVVTELIKHVQFYVKSGASLEEALDEVGQASGHTELGHSFASLAQVAKHGGEISRQMKDLADAVSAQRETKVEERVKMLELKATGPVAFVFFSFMIVLMAGFFIQIKNGMQ